MPGTLHSSRKSVSFKYAPLHSGRGNEKLSVPSTVSGYDLHNIEPSAIGSKALQPEVISPFVLPAPRIRPKSSSSATDRRVSNRANLSGDSAATCDAKANIFKGFNHNLGAFSSRDGVTYSSTPQLNTISSNDDASPSNMALGHEHQSGRKKVKQKKPRPKSVVYKPEPIIPVMVSQIPITSNAQVRTTPGRLTSRSKSVVNLSCSREDLEADWYLIDSMLDTERTFYDVDNEHQYIMRRALRSYEEHREQEKQGVGGGGGRWGRVRGGAPPGSPNGPSQRPSISETLASRTVTIPGTGDPIIDTPRSNSPNLLAHSPVSLFNTRTSNDAVTTGYMGNANKATHNNMMAGRMLTNRPRAKSAFARTRQNVSQVLTVGLDQMVRNSRVSAAFAGPRPLGSTPAARPLSPDSSEVSFQTAPPHPSPNSSVIDSSEVVEDCPFPEDAISANDDSVCIPATLADDEPADLILSAPEGPLGAETITEVKGGTHCHVHVDQSGYTCTTNQDSSLDESGEASRPEDKPVPPSNGEHRTCPLCVARQQKSAPSPRHRPRKKVHFSKKASLEKPTPRVPLRPRLPTRPVLQTTTVSIDLPMERKQQQSKQQSQKPTPGAATSRDSTAAAGQKSRGSDKKPHDSGPNARRIKSDGAFFTSVRSPKRQYFTIHPEWVSENLSVSQMTLKEKTQTYPPRRCKSAPPPRSRNPITWELSQPDLVVAQQATTTSAEPRSKHKGKAPESRVNYDGTFFTGVGTPRLESFTVHPEWVSERRTYARQSQRAQQRTNTFENIYGRRSRSAPALRSRNPITWE